MAQTWEDLLFAHWPLPPEIVRPTVPQPLPLDTYDGQAWIGVVPFQMTGVRPRGLPAAPWLSAFPELNLRTYVTLEGKPGVYFYSLDAGNPVAVALARRFYHLPYFRARMDVRRQGETIHYASTRTHPNAPPAAFEGSYRPTGPVFTAEPGSLARWLTERYCLYALGARQRVYRGEIHHDMWPLQPAEAEIVTNTLPPAFGLPEPESPPLLHFSRHLTMVAWTLQRLEPLPST
jgi:uncharacterized protein